MDFHENNSIVFLDKSLQQTNKVSSINDILKMDENVKARLQSKITLSEYYAPRHFDPRQMKNSVHHRIFRLYFFEVVTNFKFIFL